MQLTTFYDLLGVAENATQQEISSAYRKLAVELHPDKIASLPGEARRVCEARLQDVNEAYSILKGPDTRRKYDAAVAQARAEEQAKQQASAPPPSSYAPPVYTVPPAPAYQPPPAWPPPPAAYRAQPAYTQPAYVPPPGKDLYRILWPKVRTVIGIALVIGFAWLLLKGHSILKANPQWHIQPTKTVVMPHGLHQWREALFSMPHEKSEPGGNFQRHIPAASIRTRAARHRHHAR